MRRPIYQSTENTFLETGNDAFESNSAGAFPFEQDERHLDSNIEYTAEEKEKRYSPEEFPINESSWDGTETATTFRLQLAPVSQSSSCPVCLRVIQLPVLQDCGHALCWSCMQQSLASLDDCLLCQAQEYFKPGKSDAFSTVDMHPVITTGQDRCMPINILGAIGGPIVLADQIRLSNSSYHSVSHEASKGQSGILFDSFDMPLQQVKFSDSDDGIDVDDLILYENKHPVAPVSVKAFLSGSFVFGSARRPRRSLKAVKSRLY
ncbi:hypothetical protein CCR75_006163 [Bremia lactucae]|uniref:RING-type domain-containing protein n=1 Tax=Bremia lactucae TaxID=4779 RepID=A0A976IKC1_BRELC|nr:hypothetical protein CCR75_006163 [Bremia lactucae]